MISFLARLWTFSRPHTVIGTSLSVVALYLLAIATVDHATGHATGHLLHAIMAQQFWAAWLACLCGNVYIVGLNQLYDIEIDRLNKPYLPLASREFSLNQGRWIVGITGCLAVMIAASSSPWLLATIGISLVLGTAYSLPPIRLKRFPLLAALCILLVRGLVVNLGLFTYFHQALTQTLVFPPILPPILWAITLFIWVFTIAIAIFKDVPDMEGDQEFKIKTFTITLGKVAVFQITRWVITIAYLSMIAAGLFGLPTVNTTFFVVVHAALLSLLWWRSRSINLDNQLAIAAFYQFIWKLFFLEYILFPFACLLPAC